MFRLLAGKKPSDKVRVEDLSKLYGIMSMNQMASYHVLMETYKIINFGSSEKIRDKLAPARSHSRCLTVPLFRKNGCRSFSYFSSRLWNSLPSEISTRARTISEKSNENQKLNTFKREIKAWILSGGVPFR